MLADTTFLDDPFLSGISIAPDWLLRYACNTLQNGEKQWMTILTTHIYWTHFALL